MKIKKNHYAFFKIKKIYLNNIILKIIKLNNLNEYSLPQLNPCNIKNDLL